MDAKALQIMLDDAQIDELVKNMHEIKKNNQKVIRVKGNAGAPELIIVHRKFNPKK